MLLHGDGQYAPEVIESVVDPLLGGDADAVFGSRMMTKGAARAGGMPAYKYVGNRILTTMQNSLTGLALSEWHSGYRAYRVDALHDVDFTSYSDDFDFDTEIILGLHAAGKRIVEVPIPTYYGDEICRVNGVKYAKDVVFATLRNAAHRAGLLYQRRFEPVSERNNTHYDLKLGYASSHQFALDTVPAGASVIDIGAGPGGIARELVKKGCRVAVVDQFPTQGLDADVRVFTQDLDDEPTFDVRGYDYLLLLDIIEHLQNPERFLDRLRAQFDYSPRTVVLTTPNVAFGVQRVMLLLGQFNYGRAGILDRTHTRLFTFRSLRHLLDDAGFRIKEVRGVPAPFPKVLGQGFVGKAAMAVNQLLIHVSRSLFSYQIFVVAESTPNVDFILEDSRRRSDLRDRAVTGDSEEAPSVEAVEAVRRFS